MSYIVKMKVYKDYNYILTVFKSKFYLLLYKNFVNLKEFLDNSK